MYKCLKSNSYHDPSGYQLIPVRPEDIQSIREWRNAQIDILRQNAPINPDEQLHYFKTIIFPTLNQDQPKQILFSLLLKNVCIGYGGLINIDWHSKRAEISFLVDPKRANKLNIYQKDMTHFLLLLMQIAFHELKFHRLFTETFSFRKDHTHILEKVGFKKEGVLRDHVFKNSSWYDSIIHGLLEEEYAHER